MGVDSKIEGTWNRPRFISLSLSKVWTRHESIIRIHSFSIIHRLAVMQKYQYLPFVIPFSKLMPGNAPCYWDSSRYHSNCLSLFGSNLLRFLVLKGVSVYLVWLLSSRKVQVLQTGCLQFCDKLTAKILFKLF